MFRYWFARLTLALAALALPATLMASAPPNSALQPAVPTSLAGQLLIASPGMVDPRFAQSVVLLVRHDSNGAFGIVINRPVGTLKLSELLEALGQSKVVADTPTRVFYGGPVQPERVFVLHTDEYSSSDTIAVRPGIAMTASKVILGDMAAGKGPTKSLVVFGYAGWSAGQLEGELAREAWFTAPADPALVFDEPRARVWDRAMERRTRDL